MRARAVCSEAWRNLVTGTSRAGLLALTLATIAIALAGLDLLTITGQQAQARQFRDSAADIRILSAEKHIDPAGCDALAGSGTIAAAGALRPAPAITLTAVPDNPIPAYTVTPGLAAVLGVTGAGAGAWLPSALADTLGVRPGDWLPTTGGPLTIAGTYRWPDDGRDQRIDYAVLLPAPAGALSGTFDECWATTWPLDAATDDIIRTAARADPTSTQALNIVQANNNYGASYDPHADYLARSTGTIWLGTAAAGFLLGVLSTRRRRLEYASALHAGQGRGAQLATVAIETLVWAGAATITAIAQILAVATATAGADAPALTDNELNGPLLAAITAPLGAVAGALLTSERHLLRYFKNR